MPTLELSPDELMALHDVLEAVLSGERGESKPAVTDATEHRCRAVYGRLHQIVVWGYGSSRRLATSSSR